MAPMYIKGPDGKPLMSLDDWIPKDAIALIDKASDIAEDTSLQSGGASGKRVYYKWKDESDVWQMTQYKPTHIPESQVQERVVYANANIIKSLDTKTISSLTGSSGSDRKPKFAYDPKPPEDLLEGEGEESGFSLSTVSMDKIPKLIDQAQGLDQRSQDRMKAINEATGRR